MQLLNLISVYIKIGEEVTKVIADSAIKVISMWM